MTDSLTLAEPTLGTKVEVRPIEVKRWHGKTGKENFSRPKAIEVLFDAENGRYATGLTEEEAIKYGNLIGANLTHVYDYNEPHPYFSTKAATIVLPNHTVIFDTSRPVDFVKVKNMKASKFVANSLTEYNEGKWPFATHVIYDESEEVNIKAGKIQLRNKVLIQAEKMSADSKIAMIQILRGKNLKGRSNDYIDVEIADIAEKNASDFLKYVNMGKDEVFLRAQVLELIQKAILTKDGGAVYYMGDQLGFDYESTVEWFKQPENNRMKVVILEKLNSR